MRKLIEQSNSTVPVNMLPDELKDKIAKMAQKLSPKKTTPSVQEQITNLELALIEFYEEGLNDKN